MSSIDIKGIDKVQLLNALWQNQKPASFFTLASTKAPSFDQKLAAEAVNRDIDYFQGRCIKTYLGGDQADFRLYDRDAKIPGRVIVEKIRKQSQPEEMESTKPTECSLVQRSKIQREDDVPPSDSQCFYCRSYTAESFCHGRYACSSCKLMFGDDEAAKKAYGTLASSLGTSD